jgi:hypothetical protein
MKIRRVDQLNNFIKLLMDPNCLNCGNILEGIPAITYTNLSGLAGRTYLIFVYSESLNFYQIVYSILKWYILFQHYIIN